MSNSELTDDAVENRTAGPDDAHAYDLDADPEPSGKVVLELDGVAKRYGDSPVLEDFSLRLHRGELLTLLGPSGCGKTTTLRLIAGLERPDGGTIEMGGTTVVGDGTFEPPEKRGVGVVFQEFALFPHLSAAENVGFGLKDWPDEERQARVDELLDLVGLTDHRDSTPDELSGGQQQRVALARSLAPEPEMLLLDEPFSNLDVDLRIQMREEVRAILKEAGVSAISVTHDQEEAMSISDRVAVMNRGHVEQVGRPEQVFQHPRSRFVASFLGHASFLSSYVAGDRVETTVGSVPREQIHGLVPEYDHTRIDVLVRPDDISASPAPSPEESDGTVIYRQYLGPTILYRVRLDNGDVLECMHNHTDHVDLDEPVAVDLDADHELAWFPREQREDAPADD
jgi:iron(III) transport system ATP-binding protein